MRARRADDGHLRVGLVVPGRGLRGGGQAHGDRRLRPDGLEAAERTGVGVEHRPQFDSAEPEVAGRDEHARISGVEHRGPDLPDALDVDVVDDMAGREQPARHAAAGVHEVQADHGGRVRDAIEVEVTLRHDPAGRGRHVRDDLLRGVLLPDPDHGQVARGGDQALVDREGSDRRGQVPAAAAPVDGGRRHSDLGEQVVNVETLAT
jgi:hypothetical protein